VVAPMEARSVSRRVSVSRNLFSGQRRVCVCSFMRLRDAMGAPQRDKNDDVAFSFFEYFMKQEQFFRRPPFDGAGDIYCEVVTRSVLRH
jgi:hypothetical protein